jgi:hypothetical protein
LAVDFGMMHDPAVSLLAAATTVTGSAVIGAVTAAANAGTDAAPWVQGGSAVLAVAALGYIARMFADGKLVARNSAANEAALMQVANSLSELVLQSQKREDRLYDLISRHESGAS